MSQAIIDAAKDLQKELRQHIKMDVKKHYSLMVADAQLSKAIFEAEQKQADIQASTVEI